MAFMHCSTMAALVKALIKGGTVKEIAQATGLDDNTVRKYMRVWHRNGVVYIDRYKRDKGLKPWKVWRINSDNMPDAVRPVPLTNNERCQRYKAKQDRKAGKLDWRALRAA